MTNTTTEQQYAYPSAGDVIDGKYRIDGYIGEGGMGAVARAWHTLRKAPVALKFMAPHLASDPSAVERFMNEAVAASQLKSEHIVQVYDVGKLPGGSPYLVLEFLEGRDAADLVEKEGTSGLEVARAAHIVFQVLRGLDLAHKGGIIHRDLKPSNVFLVRNESDPEFVKILDFGISKIQKDDGSASITKTNMALGTPLYMSPEQARSSRDVDLRTDLYSAGVILYELLCGTAPHMVEDGAFTAVLFRLFTTDAPPIGEKRAGLPDDLVKVVHKALEREPEKRFQTARQFAEALAPFCDDRSAIEVARFRAAQTHVEALDQGRVRIHSTHDADAGGATQMVASSFSSERPPPAPSLEQAEPSVARTDLSAATDTDRPATGSTTTSRYRVPVVAGAVAAVALLVGAIVMKTSGHPAESAASDPTPPPAVSSAPHVVASVTPSAVPAPTPSVVASAAPSASASARPAVPAAVKSGLPPHVHLNRVTVIQ
jgi:serine/threonine protein kinase